MPEPTEENETTQISSATVKSCAQAAPEFDPGDLVDAFGYYEVVESRHWSGMWETWMYCFEHQEGRTPESEISKPDADTTRYPF